MMYYLIFCLATAIVTMVNIQGPVLKEEESHLLTSPIFWIIVFLLNFIFAPIIIIGLLFHSEQVKDEVREVIRRRKK